MIIDCRCCFIDDGYMGCWRGCGEVLNASIKSTIYAKYTSNDLDYHLTKFITESTFGGKKSEKKNISNKTKNKHNNRYISIELNRKSIQRTCTHCETDTK